MLKCAKIIGHVARNRVDVLSRLLCFFDNYFCQIFSLWSLKSARTTQERFWKNVHTCIYVFDLFYLCDFHFVVDFLYLFTCIPGAHSLLGTGIADCFLHARNLNSVKGEQTGDLKVE